MGLMRVRVRESEIEVTRGMSVSEYKSESESHRQGEKLLVGPEIIFRNDNNIIRGEGEVYFPNFLPK